MPATPPDGEPDPERERELAEEVARLGDRLADGGAIGPESFPGEESERAAELRRLLPALELIGRLAREDERSEVRRLGDFRLLRQIGRGGMGIVYEAEQSSLGRRVAIKILPPFSADDPDRLRRFRVEARAAASLRHPHIVPVFVVGEERGVHYFAMQLVDGRSLAALIAEAQRPGEAGAAADGGGTVRLTPPSASTVVFSPDGASPPPAGAAPGAGRGPDTPAAAIVPEEAEPASGTPPRGFAPRWVAVLGRQAAGALDHAHRRGIIHRDVKPSNLLLDAEGRLWVADFGLARLAGGEATATGAVVGTFRYMSPEQVAGDHGQVDHRTDVYSLGATLYELLVLRPAFPQAGRPELLDAILRGAPTPPRRIDPAIPRDLETIVMKAMARAREARYATAAELADDLTRYLEGRPILARPPGPRERVARWLAGHRNAAAAVAIALGCVLAASLLVAAWLAVFLASHRRELSSALAAAEDHRRINRRLRYDGAIRLAQQAVSEGRVEHAQEILDALRPLPGQEDDRGFEWFCLDRLSRRSITLLSRHDAPIVSMAVTPDGRLLVTGDAGGTLVAWDLEANRERARVRGHRDRVAGLKIDPELRLLASWRGKLQPDEPGELKLWDLQTFREVADLPIPGLVPDVLFHGPNRWIGLVSWVDRPPLEHASHTFRIERRGPGLRPIAAGPDVSAQALSPDRRWLATAGGDGRVAIRDAATFAVLGTLPGSVPSALALAVSHDGKTLAASGPGRLVFWDVPAGRLLGEVPAARTAKLPYFVFNLRFSHDDRHLIALDVNRRGLVLVAGPGTAPVGVDLDDLPRDVEAATFSQEGRVLVTTGRWSPLRVWDPATGRRIDPVAAEDPSFSAIEAPPRGEFLLLGGADGKARRWDPWSRAPVDRLPGHAGEAWSLAFSPSGDRLISSGDDHLIRVWDPGAGRAVRTLAETPSLVASVAVAAGGDVLASAGFDRTVRLWDLRTGRAGAVLKGHEDRVRGVAFSPDGRTLASASSDRTVRIWDATRGEIRHVFRGHRDGVLAVAFEPRGRCIASSASDGVILGVDPATGREAFRLQVPGRSFALAFAPDGSRLAAAGDHGRILVWETTGWTAKAAWPTLDQSVRGLAFSPDGTRLAAGGDQGRVFLWEAQSGQPLLDLQGHPRRVNAVAFSPNGRLLASASHDGSIRLWRADGP